MDLVIFFFSIGYVFNVDNKRRIIWGKCAHLRFITPQNWKIVFTNQLSNKQNNFHLWHKSLKQYLITRYIKFVIDYGLLAIFLLLCNVFYENGYSTSVVDNSFYLIDYNNEVSISFDKLGDVTRDSINVCAVRYYTVAQTLWYALSRLIRLQQSLLYMMLYFYRLASWQIVYVHIV